MHKLSIAFACVALASLACLADGRALIYFAKPDTSEEQFRRDRNQCIAETTTVYTGGCSTQTTYGTNTAPGFSGGLPQVNTQTICSGPRWPERSYSTTGFARCMQAKGYQQSAPSLPAGKPGLYELRRFSNLAAFSGRNMSNTMPQFQRQASAEALAQPGPVLQLCLLQDGAQQLGAVAGLSSSCTYSNIVGTLYGFAADASCPGGQYMRVTVDAITPDRREFTVIWRPAHGAAVPHIEKYQFNWISPTCGDIPSGAVRTPDGKLMTMADPKPTITSFATNLP